MHIKGVDKRLYTFSLIAFALYAVGLISHTALSSKGYFCQLSISENPINLSSYDDKKVLEMNTNHEGKHLEKTSRKQEPDIVTDMLKNKAYANYKGPKYEVLCNCIIKLGGRNNFITTANR